MRISRKRKSEEPKKIILHNEGIAAPRVLVLGLNGENLGVLTTAEGVRKAREQELDLVLINPKSDPPVAKMVDFGQYKYQQEKEDRIRKAHQHVVETKGIRLSLRIGVNDLNIRKNRTLGFLKDGNKVKVEIMLRGREMQHVPLAFEMIKKFVESIKVEIPIKLDGEVEKQGNKVAATIARI